MRIGVITQPRSVDETVRFAHRAEELGFWAVGVPDTAPNINHGLYPMMTAVMLATTSIRVASYVTNPVTRHWSVHAASLRALEDIGPGRTILGIANGDGAVHAVGLKPSTWPQLQEAVSNIRSHVTSDLPVMVATSGPRGAAAAGQCATDVVLATGLDPVAITCLRNRAAASQPKGPGKADVPRIWTMASVCLADDDASIAATREVYRSLAVSFARFAFDFTFEDKNVPTEWQAEISRRLRGYDFSFHGRHTDPQNPNRRMFDDVPHIRDYLVDRMLAIGTAKQCVDRLVEVSQAAGVEGYWVPVVATLHGHDPVRQLETVGHALAPLLEPKARANA